MKIQNNETLEPTVSVIMNCYNGEKYLFESINSLISQTYKNWELIFWDNLSTDNSRIILEKFSDQRIKYFSSEKFVNLYEARNLAIEKAKGKYIGFLDTDDLWIKDKLEKQIEIANEYPDVGIIYCDQFVVDKWNNIDDSKNQLIDKDLWIHFVNGWTAPNTSTLLFKKDIFKKLGGFDSELTSCQEHDLWMNIAFKNE